MGGLGNEEASDINEIWEDNSDSNIMNKIKNKGFKGELKDDFEIESDLENENITNNSKFNINLGFNILEKNKLKDIKNQIINFRPIKQIINTISYQYFNLIINNIKKSIEFINIFSPTKIDLNDLKSFSFKRSYLKDPLIKDFSIVKELENILFLKMKKKKKRIIKICLQKLKKI